MELFKFEHGVICHDVVEIDGLKIYFEIYTFQNRVYFSIQQKLTPYINKLALEAYDHYEICKRRDY